MRYLVIWFRLQGGLIKDWIALAPWKDPHGLVEEWGRRTQWEATLRRIRKEESLKRKAALEFQLKRKKANLKTLSEIIKENQQFEVSHPKLFPGLSKKESA